MLAGDPARPYITASSMRILAGIIGCVAWLALGGCGESGASEGSRPEAVSLVDVAEVTTGPLRRQRTYYGLTRSKARAQLSPAEPGTVLEVMVREGDQVETGQTLLRIDPGLVRARLQSVRAEKRQVEARRELAERQAERFVGAGSRAVPATEIDRATSEAVALNAQEDTLVAAEVSARVTLSRHQIAAPFAGVLTKRLVDPGDYVRPGEQALELVAESQVEVLAAVDASVLGELKEGMEAELRQGSRSLAAKVVGLVRALDPQTRSAQVRVIPTETSDWLIPGLAVDVTFDLQSNEEGVLVPLDALITDRAESRVIAVENAQAKPIVVEVVRKGSTHARVRAKDLKPGAQVVTRGNERLRAGQPVKVRAQ